MICLLMASCAILPLLKQFFIDNKKADGFIFLSIRFP
jgi:hypothetical protein